MDVETLAALIRESWYAAMSDDGRVYKKAKADLDAALALADDDVKAQAYERAKVAH